MLAPIVLFVYNRLWHTQQTIDALLKNELAKDSKLYIYADAAKKKENITDVEKVREYIKTINGFFDVEIIEREYNYGLANSIIDGVTNVVNKYGKIIVLEDDLVTSPYFLNYMNEGLELYEDEDKVACIHGYTFPVSELNRTFFIKGTDCWGWATWSRAWDIFDEDGAKLLSELEDKKLTEDFDFDNTYPYTKMLRDQIIGKNDSWAIRWRAAAYLKDMLTLYSAESYIQNIGNDNSGTHSDKTDDFSVKLLEKHHRLGKIKIIEDEDARIKIGYFYDKIRPSFFKKVNAKIKSILK
ncbi:MAG: glycosyl transferase [Flavobacteriales bacterium]|nr:MAG: glycosyl transferase [Flavobacteriales bacterium]